MRQRRHLPARPHSHTRSASGTSAVEHNCKLQSQQQGKSKARTRSASGTSATLSPSSGACTRERTVQTAQRKASMPKASAGNRAGLDAKVVACSSSYLAWK